MLKVAYHSGICHKHSRPRHTALTTRPLREQGEKAAGHGDRRDGRGGQEVNGRQMGEEGTRKLWGKSGGKGKTERGRNERKFSNLAFRNLASNSPAVPVYLKWEHRRRKGSVVGGHYNGSLGAETQRNSGAELLVRGQGAS